jgi:hypothetical protein
MSTVATAPVTHALANAAPFDTDSFAIMVDNCTSTSITNSLSDFIEQPKQTGMKIKGIGGNTDATMVGMVIWKVQDDQGQTHNIKLPNTYYTTSAPYHLLSPQHWSQVANDHQPNPRGTWCATYDKELVLWWDQNRYCKTIPLDPMTNVGIFYSAPANNMFNNLKQCLEQRFPTKVAIPSTIDLNQGEADPFMHQMKPQVQLEVNHKPSSEGENSQGPITFNLDGLHHQTWEDNMPLFTNREMQLMHWHLRLGHLSFQCIQQMAREGALPRQLATTPVPFFSSCASAKATRRPW